MNNRAFDLIIPTYNPDSGLAELLSRIEKQTVKPARIIIMNTDENVWNASGAQKIISRSGLKNLIQVHHVAKEDFRHGGTRNIGASYGDSPFMVFMTQDALPADAKLFEKLLEPLESPRIAMTYARQLAGKRAGEIEKITREFNYPDESSTKTAADKDRLGIKTYFASNVCAGYDRKTFEELGGFTDDVIFDEDMLYAAKLVNAGGAIRYCADARVYHSHNYSPLRQMKRNFDNGATQAMHPEVFAGIRNESEGIRLVETTAEKLMERGKPWLIPELIVQSGCKYIGFRLGRRYACLPKALVVRLSANKEYWMR